MNMWRLDPADLPGATHNAWFMAEYPEKQVEAAMWVNLFDQIGYTVDGEPAVREDDIPEFVTVYRGCLPERIDGMSWTTSLETAYWFASRWTKHGGKQLHVYRAEIPRDFVLAKVGGRSENEVVIDTSQLDMDVEAEVVPEEELAPFKKAREQEQMVSLGDL
ncbi:hypothetical protein [Aeromicrobium sp. 179-A 4D2 NHS]|uniref:hypothetical protein n=1 Tax=Aeromicrobium sp. 179-A 4D2 NHS TaxID=3142375 RepID=UPI00399F69CD